jgi:hypothetical protein
MGLEMLCGRYERFRGIEDGWDLKSLDSTAMPGRRRASGCVLRAPGFMKTEAGQLLLELPHGGLVATHVIAA